MKKNERGKVDFSTISQMYVEINSENANVVYIEGEIKKKWGEEYSLVTNDGIRLEDHTSTQGKKLICHSLQC